MPVKAYDFLSIEKRKEENKNMFLGALSLFPSLVEEGVEAYYRIEKLLKAGLYHRTFVFKYITRFITMTMGDVYYSIPIEVSCQ